MWNSTKYYFKMGLLALFVLPLLVTCKKKDDDDENSQPVDEFQVYLESQMAMQQIPALAVLIFKNDQVLYENYLGQSDRESGLALANDHLFLLASVSKAITGTALLQLYDKGEFDLDDPINNYLPFSVEVPGKSTAITFRMLLTHTSGIADGPALDDQYYYGQDPPLALATFMENYLVPGGTYYDASQNFHDFEPGTDYEYTNEGTALIGVLVEEISGMDFSSYCKQHLFTPLGMNSTFWRLDEISGTIVVPYDYWGGAWTRYDHYTFTDYPNGGLRSTARDLHRFAQIFVNEGKSQGQQILDPNTVREMMRQQVIDLDLSMGWHLIWINKFHELWGHDGGEQGVATIMGWNTTTDIGVILLTNQGEANLDKIFEATYVYGTNL